MRVRNVRRDTRFAPNPGRLSWPPDPCTCALYVVDCLNFKTLHFSHRLWRFDTCIHYQTSVENVARVCYRFANTRTQTCFGFAVIDQLHERNITNESEQCSLLHEHIVINM